MADFIRVRIAFVCSNNSDEPLHIRSTTRVLIVHLNQLGTQIKPQIKLSDPTRKLDTDVLTLSFMNIYVKLRPL